MLVVGASLVVACGGGKAESGTSADTAPSMAEVPEATGFICDDPTGDIGSDVKAVGTLSSPAGIDIVTAEAHVDSDVLAVTYTMVGPIAEAPSPFFAMLQGDFSAPDKSFELRTEPTGANGPWVLSVGINPAAGGVEQFTALATPVHVEANVLSYRVPLSDIPTISTLQWSFGASSIVAQGQVLFDDCSSLTASS